MVAKATWTVIIILNLRHLQFLDPSIEKSKDVAILYSRDNYCKVAGETCLINIAAMSGERNVVK